MKMLSAIEDSCARVIALPALSLLVLLSPLETAGQLAITEVMSAPAAGPGQRTDFWELTNFGTNTIDLTSFYFRDSGGIAGAVKLGDLADPLVIANGETIVFVQSQIDAQTQTSITTTTAEFREWWGETNLPPNLKIVFYPGFGFSRDGDAVQLWQTTATHTTLVDRIVLFKSVDGASFTYEPGVGALDTFSAPGIHGAFRSVTTADVGSPGFTTGPVPLQIVETPAGTEVDAGAPATFSVRSLGLPKPQYQWRLNGAPIPGATSRTFSRTNTTPSDAGEYTVALSNGLETIISAPAVLTVNVQPRCARIVRAPVDIDLTVNQTAIFRVEVRGYPLPAFRWQFNGANIPGATNSTYSVRVFDQSRDGIYTVHVTNSLCATNVSARLRLVPVPNLIITEAMANPSFNTAVAGHNDWWELTNADTNAVNLRGYRFDDFPAVLDDGAVVVTNDVIVLPGKSVIFVSTMSSEAFVRWWGEENLPIDLPIVSYPGNGFSPSGDLARLWNATALPGDDWVMSQGFVNQELGISLWFDPIESEFGTPSVAGERGAFRAAESDDVGSPGWISNEQRVVRPRVKSIRRDVTGVTMTWSSEPGHSYELRSRDTLTSTNWNLVTTKLAASNTTTAVDTSASNIVQRFYRVFLVTP